MAEEVIDEGAIEVPLEDEMLEDVEGEEDPLPAVSDDDPNLALTFAETERGRQELKKIALKVIEDFDAGWDASENFRQRVAEDWSLFAGELENKTFPFKDAANANVPILLENITRVAYRLIGEIFGDWQNVFGVPAMGPDPVDQEISEILTLHGNWQIREGIPDFKRQMFRYILANLVIGDVTIDSYWDESLQTNRHEVLTPEEFIIPFVYTTTMPDYGDVPWKVKVLQRYKHELEEMKDAWNEVDRVIDMEASWEDEPEQIWAEARARQSGVEIPEKNEDAPYRLLQYDGWMTLPGREKQNHVRAIVDKRTSIVLELRVHEEAHWKDQARFDRQLEEKDQWTQMLAQYEQMVTQVEQEQSRLQLMAATGQIAPEQLMMAAEQLQARVAQPPPMPEWMEGDPDREPEPPRKVPVNMYLHSVGIEPLRGALGISYGRSQADYNRAANTMLSQYIDSATLANVWSIITTHDVRFDEPFEIAPGRQNKVSGVSMRELKDSIIELKPNQANPQMKELIDTVHQYARVSMQSPEVLSGEPGKSGETYRGLAARIEQATKQLSVYAGMRVDELRHLMHNNARLNSMFLPEDEIIRITDHVQGQRRQVAISRDMYARSLYGYHVEFRTDLRFASQAQRVAEADEILQFPQMMPPLQMNMAFLHRATDRALKARGAHDMAELLGKPPPPPSMFGMPPQGPGGPPGPQGTPKAPPDSPAVAEGAAPGGIPGPKTGPTPNQ